MTQTSSEGWDRTAPLAGSVLAATALLVVFTMGHHPTGHGGGQGLTLGKIVHGAMIVFLCAQFWALMHFTLRRGLNALSLAAITAYGVSVIGHLMAATINGFIVPAVASAVDTQASHDLFVLLWNANQAFATLGIHATGLAFAFWAIHLLTDPGNLSRITGLAGLAAAIIPSALLFAGSIELNVAGAFIAYSAHSAWLVLVGILTARRAI